MNWEQTYMELEGNIRFQRFGPKGFWASNKPKLGD